MKRIVTIQDISCVGKCSLTVALPIISAEGVETSVIPTAVLSTHTMFKGFTFHDLTSEIKPIMDHWKKEGFTFDGVYTGYLGSFEQLKLAEELFAQFGHQGRILVDPCMADNGSLYVGFDQKFADAMALLCGKAEIICPNLTEASYLLHQPYIAEGYSEAYIQETLEKLTALGADRAVLTGVSLKKGELGIYSYCRSEDTFFQYYREELPQHFHGTGDIWASSFFGALIGGKGMEDSLRIATDYVCECIRVTLQESQHHDYGVNFEQAIPYLVNRLV
ncbi:MAG: pyridoxamine kinase [Erysipelotrichia bacterium]|nr:pyridoxamine kinase [Erysipelotrichia bacterium]